MQGRIVAPGELDADLVAQWQRFRTADPVYRSPFYAPQFTQAVGRVRADARIAVLERGGDVVGFLPFHQRPGGVGKPIGGHLNDYQGPILAPGLDLSSAALLQAARLSAYDYNHLPVAMGALAGGAQARSISPRMDLSQGYAAYEAKKDAGWTKARREMRRRWRKTEADIGPIRFTYHDTSAAAYAEHVAMKNALYARLGVRSVLDLGWAGQALQAIRTTQEPDFAGVFSTLRAGDRLLAAHFGMRSDSVWHWWFPSYDLDAYKLGPGINLIHQCALVAEAKGLQTIDFGRGDGDFKLLFADTHTDLCEGSMARRGTVAAGLRGLARGVVTLAGRLPLGRYESYPRRAAARLVSGVTLPAERQG